MNRSKKNLSQSVAEDVLDAQQLPVAETANGDHLATAPESEVISTTALTSNLNAVSTDEGGASQQLIVVHDPVSMHNNSQIFTAMPGPRVAGRPIVFDDTTKQQACALLATGLNFQEVAGYLGCSRNTLRAALKQDSAFAATASAAREAATAQQLLNIAAAGKHSWKAAVWLLEYVERRNKVRAGKRQQKKAALAKVAADKAQKEQQRKDDRNMRAWERRNPKLAGRRY